jgi:hypothetical protein
MAQKPLLWVVKRVCMRCAAGKSAVRWCGCREFCSGSYSYSFFVESILAGWPRRTSQARGAVYRATLNKVALAYHHDLINGARRDVDHFDMVS